MTGVAVDGGVRSDEREPVQMLVDLLDGNMPPLHAMALLAVRAHLPLVNVSMAVRALRPHIREHHLDVTLCAGHTLMESS